MPRLRAVSIDEAEPLHKFPAAGTRRARPRAHACCQSRALRNAVAELVGGEHSLVAQPGQFVLELGPDRGEEADRRVAAGLGERCRGYPLNLAEFETTSTGGSSPAGPQIDAFQPPSSW